MTSRTKFCAPTAIAISMTPSPAHRGSLAERLPAAAEPVW